MPISPELERKLLNHYKLTSLYPEEWPQQAGDDESSDDDDDDDDDKEDDQPPPAIPARHQSKLSTNSRSSLSKYRKIDRHASLRTSLSGTQKHGGVDSLVQKDEPDPLGMAPSVATELRRRGLPVEDNIKLRNRFMLSSTSFSPALYLSNVQQDASTEDLLRGLDFLSKSIEQKSASLKVLVESNFERFVRAKATIDNVYTEMRMHGADTPDSTQQPSAAGRKPHSRHTSKNQAHFRNASGAFSPANKGAGGVGVASHDKRKNALTKESEYGVLGIKTPLQDLAIKAEEVWGPALGGREREETVKTVLTSLGQHREIYSLSGSMYDAIRKSDYDTVISSWNSAQKYAAEARTIASRARGTNTDLVDADVNQIILTAKMWHDVSEQNKLFKIDLWRRLNSSHGRKSAAAATVSNEAEKEEHMELIAVLLQLGVDENPIWEWLNSRYRYLKDKITRSFERSRIEIEILRRRLAARNEQQVDARTLAKYLRSTTDGGGFGARFSSHADPSSAGKDLDSATIMAFWEKVHSSLTALLSAQKGVLGEVLEFWDAASSFIDNKAQKSFPTPVFAAALQRLELEPDHVANLRAGAVDLVNQLRENVLAFFADAPVEDLSELYSPIPPTPVTPDSAGATLTPKRSLTFDPNHVPPLSPKRGDAWEKFAFWPPFANSLSGSHYLSRLLAIIGTAAGEMASLPVIKQAPRAASSESLKALVNVVRERCVQAVSAAWIADAERVKYLEDWHRNSDRRDLTKMPERFMQVEEMVVGCVQKIAYVSEVAGASGVGEVIQPPPAKLLQVVRQAFVTGLYKALSGMVENAEKMTGEGMREADPDGVTVVGGRGVMIEGEAVDATNRNTRMLMTLSNLAHLRTEIIPHLISQFESSFSVKLTEETKTIRDVLSQIDARLFQSYVQPTVDTLHAILHNGISSPAWLPSTPRPLDAKPYVYDALLTLVLVHSEVSTTASTLTNQMLSYLLEQASLSLIDAFKTRPRYTLPALMQATLDVEFMAQTLNNYTTDRAGEVQSQIYLTLDERTDDEARKRLQGELPEMRATLKKLREGTKGEFGCFKKDRRGRGERPGSGRGG